MTSQRQFAVGFRFCPSVSVSVRVPNSLGLPEAVSTSLGTTTQNDNPYAKYTLNAFAPTKLRPATGTANPNRIFCGVSQSKIAADNTNSAPVLAIA